ncbi:uncharacterized protein LOC124712092 [Schistocerca piceifrons]|uniref:uncharacterized protein LOC124712092 n=1 Tax=Schistocerca piceifrons TaxID=274613 RepID=UPI001F5E63FF|nr:uncharacterized protein LOC124712092 [Schistocerca piceifrons]
MGFSWDSSVVVSRCLPLSSNSCLLTDSVSRWASCNSSVYFTPAGNHLCICALVFAVSPCPKRGVLRRRLAFIRRRRGTGEVSLASATWRNYWLSICCCWLLPCSANRPSPAPRAPGNTTAATGAGVPAAEPGRARSATVLHPGVAVGVLYWCDLYVMPRPAAHGALLSSDLLLQ